MKLLNKIAGLNGPVVPSIIPQKLGDVGLKMGRHRTNTTIVSNPARPVIPMSKPIQPVSSGVIKKANTMSNKYLEKIAGMAQLANGFGRKAAIGAAIGGATGALAGGENHRLSGAIGGAAIGGVVGRALTKSPVTKTVANKVMSDQTKTLVPGVTGAGRSKGSSNLAKKMTGFMDV